jgi:dipeptidyl aminopeptidase/acylaminoacyl peptidase
MSVIKTSIIFILTVLILAQSASGSELPQVTGLTQLTIDPDGTNAAGLTDIQTRMDSPCWSPDGTKIAFSDDDDIWVMDADGSNIIQLTKDDFLQTFPTWSPDGEFIAFTSNENGDLWAANVLYAEFIVFPGWFESTRGLILS